jgi:methyl-accepting chemotaxis protein
MNNSNNSNFPNLEDQLLHKQKEMESRIWLDTTLSQFDDILRNNYEKSVREFADIVITQISKITTAIRGVFFVVEKNVSIACGAYACNLENIAKKDYALGEGLIGQVAKSREQIYRTDLQEQNLVMTSATGVMRAKALLIIPLIAHQDVVGILELVYVNLLEDKQKELLNRLANNIAIMLQSIQNNAKTKELLRESLQQHEIFQSMEEELRQNMEELEATQEEMHRINQEMSTLNTAIEDTMFVVEISTQGKILRTCDLFLQHTGYTTKEILDIHYTDFLPEDEKTLFDEMVSNLKEGKTIRKEVKRKKKNGEEFWLFATYYPTINAYGHTNKIVKMSYDITEKRNQQHILEQNEVFLKERSKTIQDKAYAQIKKMREQHEQELAEKDKIIAALTKQIEEQNI